MLTELLKSTPQTTFIARGCWFLLRTVDPATADMEPVRRTIKSRLPLVIHPLLDLRRINWPRWAEICSIHPGGLQDVDCCGKRAIILKCCFNHVEGAVEETP